jgi:hypothetical protein
MRRLYFRRKIITRERAQSMTTETSTPSEMGTISCGCGKVTLTLPNAVPRFRSGCCCVECLQRAYIGCAGHPPDALRNLEEPVDLFYVDSRLMQPDPETLANLAVFRLNSPDASNINLRATCCGAVLCTENQEFHVPNSMATFNNLQPFVRCDFSEVPESKMNVFTKDWPEDKRKALGAREATRTGVTLPQIFDPREALEEAPILEIIAALGSTSQVNPEGSISFSELYEGMEVTIEDAYFDEARAQLP